MIQSIIDKWVGACTIADLRDDPRMAQLIEAYTAESGVAEMGAACPQWQVYEAMEQAGLLYPFRVKQGHDLIGFGVLLWATVPHFGKPFASIESFYIDEEHRAGGIGLRLLDALQNKAKSKGLNVIMATAPVGSALARVLPRKGYRHSNEVFVRCLS